MDQNKSSCCTDQEDHCGGDNNRKLDKLLWGSVGILTLGLLLYALPVSLPYATPFGKAVWELLGMMWWGILFGIVAVGLLQGVPRAYIHKILGKGDTFGGLVRAAIAGLLLDLCSHGILMVGAKLYERGASLAQVMTFLIASPWNSLTLTLILISLVGLKWTLVFIAGSVVIALLTGVLYLWLTRAGILPGQAHSTLDEEDEIPDLMADAKQRLGNVNWTPALFFTIAKDGLRESKMVLRWLFFGVVLAAAIRAFVPTEIMIDYFGPTLMGLGLTLLATTIIEVCSEGSTPIAAELFTRAKAPGNAFTFLMAGVATDYTEILVIKEFTKKWAVALSLPLLTVPQVVLLGWVMNQFGAG